MLASHVMIFMLYIQVKLSLLKRNITLETWLVKSTCMSVLWSYFQAQFKTISCATTPLPLPLTFFLSLLFTSLHLCLVWPDTMRSGCCLLLPSLKSQRICRVTTIVLPYWSLTGHIEAQQDFKGTKAVYCIVLSSKWRSPSSYGEQSLEMSAERRFMGEEAKGEMVNY